MPIAAKNGIATVVYEKFLSSNGAKQKLLGIARRALIKLFDDPICALTVHGRLLMFPISHPLPLYYNTFRLYDRLPGRITRFFHMRGEFLKCIDVGANVGDTIASFYESDEDSDCFLAIEPNPKFHQYLLSNWGQHNNVTLVAAICTSQSGLGLFKISQEDGTARVRPATDGVAMIETSLDTIVADYPAFEKANVIKIDTDGYDFEVIAGARELIANNLPAVLFECDVFDSSSYVENCLSTFEFFAKCGYQHFLLYDNLGFFFGQYSLVDLQPFKNLLIYQITGRRCYFDILLMREEDLAEFLLLENNFFADIVSNLSLAQTIRVAMQ